MCVQDYHASTCTLGSNVPAMMRALVATNVLARREETVLFLPVNPTSDPQGEAVVQRFLKIHAFAVARAIIQP